ncbi:MAG: UDP-N-acetylmuramoyl-tripeptide--D-alanyl-D-alanine ligase [Saprospiraceae bacterium]|nr:UDP-N-acetylmuramoyl-tripeptide--D-alanyl-D-alanine ligase [Saprospiraceae bacterium]
MDTLLQLFLSSRSICTDSRKVKSGDLFFALKGANFDGNEFVLNALEKGALAAVADDATLFTEAPKGVIMVDNALQALQQLARKYRDTLQIPVVALTGSNGKTTTKELVATVLAQKYKVHFTQGNLNNEIGVPLTLLSTPPDSEILIVEMGANHQGEIDALCRIANPEYGLITNIGLAHLEGFGGPEGVKKGKSEMYRYLHSQGGTIFLNISDSTLVDLVPEKSRVLTYAGNDYTIVENTTFLTLADDRNKIINTQLTGDYNKSNVVAAIFMGSYFGVAEAQVYEALENYIPTNNRSQQIDFKGCHLIKDAYNANPSSMTSALHSLIHTVKSPKVVILGDMLELGDFSQEEHQKVLDLVCSQPDIEAVMIGPRFGAFKDTYTAKFYNSVQEAYPNINWKAWQGKTVLLKGSRGIALEKLLEE